MWAFMMQAFKSESELVDVALNSSAFYQKIGYTDWYRWQECEMEGLFGVPDVVCCFSKTDATGRCLLRTFAFEMKLSDWKRALTQAFKYASFAHYPFVVMDHRYVERAKRHIEVFERSNIGLISVDPSGKTFVHFRPRFRQPYSPSLKKHVDEIVIKELAH